MQFSRCVAITVTAIDDSLDTDNDGLTDQDEKCTYGTLFNDPDTDNDGLSDGDEANVHSTDPLSTDTDTDEDHLDDGDEVNIHGTDPLSGIDTDN